MNEFEECIAKAFSEAGISATDEQIKIVAERVAEIVMQPIPKEVLAAERRKMWNVY